MGQGFPETHSVYARVAHRGTAKVLLAAWVLLPTGKDCALCV